MSNRKPALLAATVALAVTPALTALTPAFAAGTPTPAPTTATNPCANATATPAPTPTTAPSNTPLIELVLTALPEPVQCDARQLLTGNFNMLLPLLNDTMHLTPAQLSAIFAKLQGLAGLLPGGSPSTSPSTSPSVSPSVSAAAAADVELVPLSGAKHKPKPKPISLNARQKAQLRALLAQLKGGHLTAPEVVHIILTVGLMR